VELTMRNFLIYAFGLLPLFSWADAYDLPQVVAIESRLFQVKNEITPEIGILPLDAFNKSLTYGGTYTHYFSSYWGWEVLEFKMANNMNTGLKNDLITQFNVRPQGILDSIKYYGMTNLVYTPVYSKNLFFNQSIYHSDTSFVLGVGSVNFESGESAPIFGGGLMLRYFLGASTNIKLNSRLYYHTGQNKSSNFLLALNIGFSIQFGSTGGKASD
jgi:outer membrane beta-barrel protein